MNKIGIAKSHPKAIDNGTVRDIDGKPCVYYDGLPSISLTMTLKIAVENNPKTQWVAVLLGPDVEPSKEPQMHADKHE